ncbi:MAG TPA: cobalamin-independent methionine synthase II family protein [Xanthobacteraceae bacterium]|jgi:5-methyltetrahydropteroyltriglutamate--homocysteine methyltransferase
MNRSIERVLTTHVGSLPRPPPILDAIESEQQGRPVDDKAYAARLRSAVKDVVRQQIETGIDIIDDGELGKASFVSYVNERLGGFELDRDSPRQNPWAQSREARSFPEFYAASPGAARPNRMVCTAPVTYRGMARLQIDLDNLTDALSGADVRDVFMPAISPASAADWLRNRYYKTDEEYLFAIAEALREEYEAIARAGFLLQIDDPQLVTYWTKTPDLTLPQWRKWAEMRVEALNHALRNVPAEKIRHHTCYGINMGPRVHDLELKDIVDVILNIRAGAYSFEAANPRHEHEWTVWERGKLPGGKSLIPGVISHSTVLVEHPELVAQRIARFARLVGRENVIAGADCGFATFALSNEVHPRIVWAKLASLVEGARLASKQLWAR